MGCADDRFSVQEKLWGYNNQKKIKKSKILIIGAGATGSNIAEILARAGVGELTIMDDDIVELSNIHRQIYDINDINKKKVIQLKEKLLKINPRIKINIFTKKIEEKPEILEEDFNIIIDSVDNLKTRLFINKKTRKKKNVIYTGVSSFKGFVLLIKKESDFCFECVFKNKTDFGCEEGIFNPAVKLVSSIASSEAEKLMINIDNKESLNGLFYFNLLRNNFNIFSIKEKCDFCKKKISNN